MEEFDALCGFVCCHHIPRYMCKDSEMSSAWTSGRGREKKENGKIPYQQNMSKLYRTTTVAVGSHGKKEKRIGTVETARAKKLDKSMRSVTGRWTNITSNTREKPR